MADDIKEKYINPYTDFGFKKLFRQLTPYGGLGDLKSYCDCEDNSGVDYKKRMSVG